MVQQNYVQLCPLPQQDLLFKASLTSKANLFETTLHDVTDVTRRVMIVICHSSYNVNILCIYIYSWCIITFCRYHSYIVVEAQHKVMLSYMKAMMQKYDTVQLDIKIILCQWCHCFETRRMVFKKDKEREKAAKMIRDEAKKMSTLFLRLSHATNPKVRSVWFKNYLFLSTASYIYNIGFFL